MTDYANSEWLGLCLSWLKLQRSSAWLIPLTAFLLFNMHLVGRFHSLFSSYNTTNGETSRKNENFFLEIDYQKESRKADDWLYFLSSLRMKRARELRKHFAYSKSELSSSIKDIEWLILSLGVLKY